MSMILKRMRRSDGWIGAGFALAVFLLTAVAGRAESIETYRAKLEVAASHLRVAWSYARTGNADLAGLEADAFAAAWADLERSVQASGSAFQADPAPTIGAVRRLAEEALALIDSSKLPEARQKLSDARAAIRAFHKKAGVETFGDCIWDANRAGDPLWAHIRDRPDLKSESVAAAVGGAAATYSAALEKCNRTASAEVSGDPEFRRLMDGALKSLAFAEQAAGKRDGDLLHRYLIEIISIDRLLFFRFG